MTQQAHILIVEDDPALRIMLSCMLALHDFKVSEAGSRIEALETLRTNAEIEVVILDLGLPPYPNTTTEGLACLRTLHQEFMNVKVIILTGQDHEEAALEGIREGAFDFLSKPATSEIILHAVRRAFLFVKKESELALEGITRIAINAQVKDGLKAVRMDAEERLVRQVLKETSFNVAQSAKRLGIKRENIYYFLKKFGITRDD